MGGVDDYNIKHTFTRRFLGPYSFEIQHDSEWRDTVTRHATLLVDTQESAIRAGLISLGWTPPK